MPISTIVAVVVSLAAGWFAHDLYLQDRRRRMRVTWPVKTVGLTSLDPIFATTNLGPTLDAEVHFIGRGPISVPGGTTDAEAWVLAALAKKATSIFEFGTCTGKTTYLLARNASSAATVTTITLTPAESDGYQTTAGDDRKNTRDALRESTLTHFLYQGSAVESKIRQLYGDSKAFDDRPFAGACDLIFVDGSHAYSYVLSDSDKALRMLKPGGLVLWHDYVGPEMDGTFRGLNELGQRLPIVHIEGTSFVAYRKPLA